MSNILDCIPIGEEVEVRGPTGEIVYDGQGKFIIEDQEMTFKKISLVLGGGGKSYASCERGGLDPCSRCQQERKGHPVEW